MHMVTRRRSVATCFDPRSQAPACVRRVIPVAMIVLAGCGMPHYQPIELIGPSGMNASTVTEGTVDLRVRMGSEGLELRVVNRGNAPLEVDWGSARLIENGGETHQLVDLGLIRTGHGLATPGGTTFDPPEPRYQRHDAENYVFLAWFDAAPHRAPRGPGVPVRHHREMVAPGASATVVLYPAEHVRASEYGWRVVAPLFCRVGDGRRYFAIHLPVAGQEGGRTMVVAGRTVAAAPR
jgi:hypothetical protein